MPLPIPFYLRNSQTSPLTHTQLDGNLSILSTKIDNTTITNMGTGIGIFTTKAVRANDGVMNLHTLAGTGGISVVAGSDGIIIDGSGTSGGSGTDYYTTGLTFNQGTYDLTVSVNDGNDYTVGLGILSSDMNITGGIYDPSTGIATFTNNSGGTFQVTGFLVGYTDTNTYVTGGTYNQTTGISTFTNSSGGTFEVVGYFTGGTSNFDWCDAYVMSGNTSGCCIDTLWVTTLSGCSPIYIGGSPRQPGLNGNVNVDGVLNIKKVNQIALEPTKNSQTPYVLMWNDNASYGGLTPGDVESLKKKALFQQVHFNPTPWDPDIGPIEIGTDLTGGPVVIVIGPNEPIRIKGDSADTQISLTYSSATVTASTVTTPSTEDMSYYDVVADLHHSWNSRIDNTSIYEEKNRMGDGVDQVRVQYRQSAAEIFEEKNVISGTTSATTTNTITPERITFLQQMCSVDYICSSSNIERLGINTIENTLQTISGTTSATTKMSTVDGFSVESSIGGVVTRSSMGADQITTTGTISASIISATTVIVGGVSLSACCEIDAYYSGGTPAGNWTWDLSGQSTNFEITLVAGTSQLDLTNVINGVYGTIIVHQDATGGRALTFGTINGGAGTHYVVNGGGGVPTLTSTANAIDILSFTYNGTAAFWTAGGDYN